jgi:tetratricopeptide (TPR) repeat protein
MLRHGDRQMGAAYIRDALAMAESMPESLEYAPALLAMAELVGLEDAPEAMAYARQAIQAGRTAELQAEAYLFMATADAATGRPGLASENAQRALRIAERLGSPWLVNQARQVSSPVPPDQQVGGSRAARPR